MSSAAELERLLTCISAEILPRTRAGVSAGNKVFGAAVLRPDASGALQTLVADTNHETDCPLFHGEVYVIQEWAREHPEVPASDCVFLATHEPCCLCISAIVWAGFKRCYFLYPYETTRDQGIPHDIDIMTELWRVERYNPDNKFCRTQGLLGLIEAVEVKQVREEMRAMVQRITDVYDELSEKYHTEKRSNSNNTLAFN